MKYKLIRGKFWVRGFSPDGDSIRFTAEDKANQTWFDWKSAGNKGKAAGGKEIKMQLRLEAVDALETHYNGKYHQPRSFGIAGMDRLLEHLGITVFKYSIDYTKITAAEDGAPGFIVTSGLDMYERPISFVYGGNAPDADGTEYEEYPEHLIKKSINYRLLSEGIVYPTFYQGLDPSVMNEYAALTAKTRKNNVGLWAIDKTGDFVFWETWTIQDDILILPKLFRRLATFIDDYSDYAELASYFKKSKDPVLVRSQNRKVDLSDILTVDGRRLSLCHDPEDLLFIPK